jgi:hypothetical protein
MTGGHHHGRTVSKVVHIICLAGALFLVGACATPSDDAPPPESLPLPRARPAPGMRVPPVRPSARQEDQTAIVDWSTAEATRTWTLCKVLFAEGLAQRTDRPLDDILAATFAACSSQEEEFKSWLAQQRMRPKAIADVLSRIRDGDRVQLTARIRAARQGR